MSYWPRTRRPRNPSNTPSCVETPYCVAVPSTRAPDAAGLALLVGLDDRPQDASEVGQIGADPLRAPQHSNRVHGRRDRRLDVVAHRGIAARDQIGVGGGERRRRRRLAPRVRHPQRQAVRQRPIDQGGPPAAPRQRHAARNGQCGRRQQPQASSGRHGTSFKGVSPVGPPAYGTGRRWLSPTTPQTRRACRQRFIRVGRRGTPASPAGRREARRVPPVPGARDRAPWVRLRPRCGVRAGQAHVPDGSGLSSKVAQKLI